MSAAENAANTRTRLDSYEIQRGSIIVGNTAIASSQPTDDRYQYQRVYTDAEMWAPVTGYYNPVLGSATGIEKALKHVGSEDHRVGDAPGDRVNDAVDRRGVVVDFPLHGGRCIAQPP